MLADRFEVFVVDKERKGDLFHWRVLTKEAAVARFVTSALCECAEPVLFDGNGWTVIHENTCGNKYAATVVIR